MEAKVEEQSAAIRMLQNEAELLETGQRDFFFLLKELDLRLKDLEGTLSE